ncbi:MAG: metal transporter [Candidatus Marinimicrobia bacterium]|nr:metal transporter [Candidatus Neomarinimicrobiota bacterium]
MKRWFFAFLPLILLGILVALILTTGPLGLFRTILPPIQELAVERIVLKPDEILLYVVNDGPDPITIAQVMVNGAFWNFRIEPRKTLPRLGRGTIRIPYPWVEGDTEHITLLTRDGVTFEVEVEVATVTPTPDFKYLSTFALLGFYVGVIPVFLGLLWLPFLKRLRSGWYSFFLALSVGLLFFLGVDALVEAIETTDRTPKTFQGVGVLIIGLSLSFLILSAISRQSQKRAKEAGEAHRKLVLAFLIAFGIGVHNLGEGLAIGAAYAIGEVALGALLVLGFMIHNVTEGVAIIAPIARTGPSIRHLGLMGLLAGGPTILGTWIGGFSYSAIWAVLFLAIGAGAVFQVIIQIVRQMAIGAPGSLATFGNVAGFAAGLLIMYATGFFVAM